MVLNPASGKKFWILHTVKATVIFSSLMVFQSTVQNRKDVWFFHQCRPVARKILQPRHYFKKCARIEFYKLLALYHEDSKVVVWHCRWIQNEECVDSFTYFSLLHYWGGLRLNLLTTYAKKTNKQTKKKRGNFNRGECLGLPHTGYGPDVTGKTWTTAVANTWLWPSTLRGTIKEFRQNDGCCNKHVL